MPFADHIKDTLMAPDMSKFTSADIEDLSSCDPEQDHWISNFILNGFGGVNFKTAQRQYAFSCLRNTQAAFREYALARDQTLLFLCHPNAVPNYMLAITHWEHVLHRGETAWDFLRKLADQGPRSKFKQGEGSLRERINKLYNLTKHASEGEFATESTLAVWLTNDGLQSTTYAVKFKELATDLRDLAKWTDRLQEPATFRDKVLGAIEAGEE